jgi:hypothetical protein
MKNIITILAIILLGGIAYSQDTTTFVPNYGIELGSYSEVKTFGVDKDTVTNVVYFMYPKFTDNSVIFYYDLKSYKNDSLVYHDNRIPLAVPLNATIQGKKAWEWINMTVPKLDTTIYKGMATELYKRKVLKMNR